MQTRIPPPALALLTAALMAGLNKLLPIAALRPPIAWGWGLATALLGVGLASLAALQFHRAQTTTNPLHPERAAHLVTTGVFRASRNPMYVGLSLVLCGWAIVLGSLGPWIALPTFVAAVTWLQILPEERALARIFADQYADYCARTGRWVSFK